MISFINWNVDPEIFKIGGLSIRWYSICFLVGFTVSYQMLKYYFKMERVSLHLLDSLTIYVVVATVVGARLGHCFFYDYEYYSHHLLEVVLPFRFKPEFEFTGYQGLASHGGAIAILAAIVLFSYRKKISFWWILDHLALVVPLAGFLIRFGNLMNSEIVGKPSNLPWAFIFEKLDHIPRHPGQLYEAILYLMIFLFLNWFHFKVRKEAGFIFGLFLALLFLARFIVEFFKEIQSPFESGMILNMGQLLSIPFIILGICIAVWKRNELPDQLLEK